MNRRHFIRSASGTAGLALSVSMLPNAFAFAQSTTINEIINKIILQIVPSPLSNTVDTVKIGDTSQICTGIVSTFMANVEVIMRAKELGANLIVTHEPTFYNHLDETKWMVDDKVYEGKKKLLEESGIVMWRFHDYWHRYRPDGVREGVVRQLKWEKYWTDREDVIAYIPKTTLSKLSTELAKGFGAKRLSYIGDGDMAVSNVALLPGSVGRDLQIATLQRNEVEVLVVGEVAEWETSEYVRDASSLGLKKGLIIVGHQASEEPGMAYAAEWMQGLFPDIKVTHVNSKDAFTPIIK